MDVQQLVDDAAFLHADAALALHDAVGASEPVVDLRAGTATFLAAPGKPSFEIQVLGVERPDRRGADATGLAAMFGVDPSGVWEWAWAIPGFAPPELVRLSAFVRDIGRKHELDELAADRVELGRYAAAHLVMAAKTIVGRIASVVVEGPDASRVHLLLDLPPSPSGVRQASAAITAALEQGLVRHHRRALRSYAKVTGLRLESPDASCVTLVAPGGRLEIGFDDNDRIERITTKADASAALPALTAAVSSVPAASPEPALSSAPALSPATPAPESPQISWRAPAPPPWRAPEPTPVPTQASAPPVWAPRPPTSRPAAPQPSSSEPVQPIRLGSMPRVPRTEPPRHQEWRAPHPH